MKIALLGADATTLAVAAAALAEGAELAMLCDMPEAAARALPALGLPAEMPVQPWESLLAGGIDAVLAAPGDEDARGEQLRRLVQERVPVLAVHPLFRSMLLAHELEMIRREVGGVLVPCLPEALHGGFLALMELQSRGSLGALLRLALERRMADPGRSAVLRQLAIDLALLQRLGGEFTRLGAVAPAMARIETAPPSPALEHAPPDYSRLDVQLTCDTACAARWSVAPPQFGCAARLTASGSGGTAVLEMSEGVFAPAGQWKLSFQPLGADAPEVRAYWDNGAAARAWRAFRDALAGRAADGAWLQSARAIELADAAEKSLKKGKVLELHFGEYTEKGTFKGTMTSLGCAALLLALGVMLLGIVVGKNVQNPLVKELAGWWPTALVIVLAAYLFLQLLLLVFRPDEK